MALKTYIGQDPGGDWETASNWIGGSVPVDDDAVEISESAVIDLTVNVDRSAGTGLDLASFLVKEGCRIKIGSAQNPLTLTCDDIFEHRGSGDVFFQSKTGSAGDTTGTVACRQDEKGVPGAGSPQLFLSGDAAIARLFVTRGICSLVDSNLTITDAFVDSLSPRATVMHHKGTVTNISVGPGSIWIQEFSTTDDGTFNEAIVEGFMQTSPAQLNPVVWINNGRVDWRCLNTPTNIGAKIYLTRGGTLDVNAPGYTGARGIGVLFDAGGKFLRDEFYFLDANSDGWSTNGDGDGHDGHIEMGILG